MSMNDAKLILQDSHDVERYTPSEIVEAGRSTMGSINLDPASCALANKTVKAERYFTKEDDGLSKPWVADTLFLNHPYSKGEKACSNKCTKKICRERGYHIDQDQPGNTEWINKLVSEYKQGNVKQACSLVFASTSEGWIEPLLNYPMCLIRGRVSHATPATITAGVDPKSGTKGSAVFYLGPNVMAFYINYSKLGSIYVPFPQTIGTLRKMYPAIMGAAA